MERYFIITKENKLRKDYLDYEKNFKDIWELSKIFFKEHSIKTKSYIPDNDRLYIEANREDMSRFEGTLCKEGSNGMCGFKKNSKVAKAWIETLKNNNLKVIDKPWIGFYFDNCYGRSSSRLFSIDDIVYCSINLLDREIKNLRIPEGIIEIKASEFFKIIEDDDELNNNLIK